MKAYGHTRKDMQRCSYGCCGFKSMKEKNCRHIVDKSKRKSARQGENRDIEAALLDE